MADEGKAREYRIVNAYDGLVRQTVREAMEKQDMCRCEKCFLDVCTLVFNKGYSKFVTTLEGELYAKIPDMNHGDHIKLFVTVLEAIALVQKRPMH